MTLGEAYLRGILRPPPTDHVPANVAHPFQKSFLYYVQKKAIPKHWFLATGFAFTLTLYGILDGLRDSGKKKAYDEAVLAGKAPCECPGRTGGVVGGRGGRDRQETGTARRGVGGRDGVPSLRAAPLGRWRRGSRAVPGN